MKRLKVLLVACVLATGCEKSDFSSVLDVETPSVGEALEWAPGLQLAPGPILTGEMGVAGPLFSTAASSGTGCPAVTAFSTAKPFPLCETIRTTTQTLSQIYFEGLRNDLPVSSKIARATFAAWHSLIDLDNLGGSVTGGNFAYEPSDSTAIFWDARTSWPSPYYREIAFDQPVAEVSLYYVAQLSGRIGRTSVMLPFPHITLTAYNGSAVVDSATGPQNVNTRPPGDPSGNFDGWRQLVVQTSEADNLITKVRISGYNNWLGVDNVYYRQVNFRPIARPGGPYAVNEGETVSFDGSVSYDPVDASGQPHNNADPLTSYLWDFGDGSTATTPVATHRYASSGEYTATLTVSDLNGLTHTASVSVVVANQPPVVNAGADAQLRVGQPFNLKATFADPGGADDKPWSYAVNWGDGNASSGSRETSGEAIEHSRTYAAAGTYRVRVVVTDRNGASGEDEVVVTVVNEPPVVALTAPSAAQEGAEVSFGSAGSQDPEGGALTFAWEFGDGATSTEAAPRHTYRDNGSYTVTLQVSDPHGGVATKTALIAITNVAPTARLTHTAPVDEGETLSLTLADATDPSSVDRAALRYEFDCGTGTYTVLEGGSTAACQVYTSGARTVRGRISDKDGASSEYTASVTVRNVAPTVSASGSAAEVRAGDPFTVSFSFQDPGRTETWAYRVEWGEGSPTTGAVSTWSSTMRPAEAPSRTYTAAGSYTVQLTVTDSDGGSRTVEIPVVVRPRNRPPTVSMGGPYSGREGMTLPLGWSADDADLPDDALSYAWSFGAGADGAGATLPRGHTYADNGEYTLRLTATDRHGAQAGGTATVRIENAPPEVRLQASEASLARGEELKLRLGVSDLGVNDGPWAYTVTWSDGEGARSGEIGDLQQLLELPRTFSTVGPKTATVVVTDKDGGRGTATLAVEVLNRPPSVQAMANLTAQCTTPQGARVRLTGTAADPDRDPLQIAWLRGSTPVATALEQDVTLQRGVHDLTLRATDPFGASATDGVRVTVEDTEAPVVQLSATPGMLWPPNHKYHTVSVGTRVVEACSGEAGVEWVVGYVESNEADEAVGRGDGNTTGDIRVTPREGGAPRLSSNARPRVEFRPGDTLEVRAERFGTAAPRVYTITLQARDAAGNLSAVTQATVVVDHDQGNRP